jgi:hypothetical protein
MARPWTIVCAGEVFCLTQGGLTDGGQKAHVTYECAPQIIADYLAKHHARTCRLVRTAKGKGNEEGRWCYDARDDPRLFLER